MAFPFDTFPMFPDLERAFGASRAFPLDVTRTGDTYTVTADVPGVDGKGLDISVDGSQLTITVERQVKLGDDAEVFTRERPSGKATRQLTLSSAIDTSKIEASIDNGVLTLTLPLAESAKPRKIAVTAAHPAAVSA